MRDRPNEKLRDIARSVLPSKASRKEKAALHKRERRVARNDIHRSKLLEDYDDFEEEYGLGKRLYRREEKEIVSSRRSADKLGAFKRWATAHAKDQETEPEKHSKIKSIIGSSTIKDHAIDHFAKAEDNPTLYKKREKEKPNACPWSSFEQLVGLVRKAIERYHSKFNELLGEIEYRSPLPTGMSCLYAASRPCWVEKVIDHRHNENKCARLNMVACLSYWRRGEPKLPPGSYPNIECWEKIKTHIHDELNCWWRRRNVANVSEAVEAAKWIDGTFCDEYPLGRITQREKAFAAFAERHGLHDIK